MKSAKQIFNIPLLRHGFLLMQSIVEMATPDVASLPLTRASRRCWTLSLLTSLLSCSSEESSVKMVDQAATASVRIGQGFNSLGGVSYSTEMSYCAGSAPLVTFGGSSGESIVLYIASAKSERSLQEELVKSLSAGLAYEGGNQEKPGSALQSVNNLTGKFDLSSKREIQSVFRETSVYVIVRARKTFSTEVLSDFKVAPNVASFFADRPQDFFSRCGDRFVSGVKKGAEITAYMRCETGSQEIKEKVAKDVSASGGLRGVSAKSTIQEMLSKVSQEMGERCTYSYMPRGGTGTLRADSNQKFIDSALEYIAGASLATAVPIEFETMPYAAILDKDFHDTVLKKTDLDLVAQRSYVRHKEDVMSFLSREVSRLLDSGQDNPNMIGPLLQGMEEARQEADRCLQNVNNPAVCKSASKWPIKKK